MTQELINFVTVADTQFAVACERTVRIGINGNLLFSNRGQLKQLVVDQIERGDKSFILDCTRCRYIDSSGLGVVVSIARRIEQAGGSFVIENLNQDLQTLFHLTQLDTFLTLRNTNG